MKSIISGGIATIAIAASLTFSAQAKPISSSHTIAVADTGKMGKMDKMDKKMDKKTDKMSKKKMKMKKDTSGKM